MTNFGKLLLIAVIVVALGGTVFLLNKKAPVANDVSIPSTEDSITITGGSVNITPSVSPKDVANVNIFGNKNDLVSFSIPVGSTVSGTQTATGTVTGGYFFEGNIIIRILDGSKNILRTTHGTATTDWMTSGPVSFTTNLDFTGITTGPGYIEIHNDNASGLPANDKSILVPIVIQ